MSGYRATNYRNALAAARSHREAAADLIFSDPQAARRRLELARKWQRAALAWA